MEEGHGGIGLLIGEDGREGDAGVVVDGDVNVFPAHAAGAVGRIAGDAMARPDDAAQLLDVQVQQIAGAPCS